MVKVESNEVERRLIASLSISRDRVRFDANLDQHHHYVCVRCGLTKDFKSEGLNALRIPEAVKEFGSIITTHIEVRGICDSCAEQQADNSVPKNPKEP